MVERAETAIYTEDEVALYQYENVRDIFPIQDIGERGFQISRVRRSNWIQTLGDGEKFEDLGVKLGRVDVYSARRGERVRAVQDDSRAA